MGSKLSVGNLSKVTTIEDLQNMFNRAGLVMTASIAKDEKTGASKGFGTVTMSSDEAAVEAIKAMNGFTLHDHQITVTASRE